jgi:putative zinc finger protein
MAHDTPIEKGRPPLRCEEWQELLVDALDGTLAPDDLVAFNLHAQRCEACAQLLEETRRGSEWLGYLHHAPEAPGDLVDKILARTSGTTPSLPVMGGVVPAVEGQPWLGRSVAILQRHGAESRVLMTLAMAFFSIAFTLNLTGIRLRDLRLADLSPATLASNLSRQYYTASAHLVRYYENLRFVYEVESRMNELRRDTTAPTSNAPSLTSPSPSPGNSPATSPQQSPQTSPRTVPEKSAPAGKPSSRNEAQPGPASPSTDDRGPKHPPATDHISAAPAQPVYAFWALHPAFGSGAASLNAGCVFNDSALPQPTHHNSAAPRLSERNAAESKSHGRAERSLA